VCTALQVTHRTSVEQNGPFQHATTHHHRNEAPGVALLNSAMQLLFSARYSRVQGDQSAIHRSLCDERRVPPGLKLSLAPFTLIAPSAVSLGWDDARVRAHLQPSRRPPSRDYPYAELATMFTRLVAPHRPLVEQHVHVDARFCAASGGVSPAVLHAFFNLPAHAKPKELVLRAQAWFLAPSAAAGEAHLRGKLGGKLGGKGVPRIEEQLAPPVCRAVPRIAACAAEPEARGAASRKSNLGTVGSQL
jgi:hypothetical protein